VKRIDAKKEDNKKGGLDSREVERRKGKIGEIKVL
jgi:hypothetical protein